MKAQHPPLTLSCFFFSLFLLLPQSASADLYKVGSPVDALVAKDQHGNAFQLKKGVRYLLVTFDMSTGKKANKALAEKGEAYLTKKKAVYVANIHGMPGIGRAFALPKMRRYPHTIILADEEDLLTKYPRKEKLVTVLKLDDQGKVLSIFFWDPKTQKIDDVLAW